mgnify:CR=1 FL=1
MSKNMYIDELKKKLTSIEKEITAMAEKLKEPKSINDDFITKYRELNEKRLEAETIKSRIKNYGVSGIALPNITIGKL